MREQTVSIASRLYKELEYYRKRRFRLEAENKRLKEELLSLKATLSAGIARGIDVKSDIKRSRNKKSKRKKGHNGLSIKRLEHIDARVIVDKASCLDYGNSTLLERSNGSYTCVVADIVSARLVVTEYTINRRYCSTCKKQATPTIQGVLPNCVFGSKLMFSVMSLKLLGLSYEKISNHP